MTRQSLSAAIFVLLTSTTLRLQAQTAPPVAAAKTKASISRTGYYIGSEQPHLERIIPPPPARESLGTTQELHDLHQIESTRTAAQIKQAQDDEAEETIFLFRSVISRDFNAESLPLTAALSKHLRDEESFAGSPLKAIYLRPRPYQADPSLHPVCAVTTEPNSYPSGHALSGYLLGFTLIQMVPEKRLEILARADEYAHERLICGVHYPSDTEASREVAYAIFGMLRASPHFQHDLEAARQEARQKLGLPASSRLP